jgi:hypothetical protein
MGWIERGDSDREKQRILWLSGPAGSGKTAIAGTIADECQRRGWLAGSFFFSASSLSPERWTKDALITTLAYQLLEHEALNFLKDEILASIDKNPIIFGKRLDEQLQVLILEPLRKARKMGRPAPWPKVIIIDGLDECSTRSLPSWAQWRPIPSLAPSSSGTSGEQDGPTTPGRAREKAQKEILAALHGAITSGFPEAFPFRIIITSRPEAAICESFSENTHSTKEIFLDNKYNPDADIALYFRAKFSAIRLRYDGLPENWVSEEIIKFLVQEASGQFIYATTVVRFVENATQPPLKQLKRVLEWRRADSSKPFAPLDLLYSHIVETSPVPIVAAKWIRTIQYLVSILHSQFEEHNSRETALFVRYFLEAYPGEMNYLLGGLTSLLRLPSKDNNHQGFHFYHKSLFDFIEDSNRSKEFGLHVDNEMMSDFTSTRFVEVMKSMSETVLSLRTALTEG